jgi:hypothetical protein
LPYAGKVFHSSGTSLTYFRSQNLESNYKELICRKLANKDSQRLYARVLNQIYYLYLYFKIICANVQESSHIREVNNTTPNSSGQLGPILAGLIESDGVLVTPKNSSITPTINISLHEKDRPFAEHFKTSLG